MRLVESCSRRARRLLVPPLVLALGFVAWADGRGTAAADQEQANQLDGTYTFLKDSDGNQAPANVKIMLTFSGGATVLVSAPPQPLYTDSGSYEYAAGILKRFVLPRLGKFAANGKVEFGSDSVILPFKMLNSGVGTSTWQAPPRAGNRAPEPIQPVIDAAFRRVERQIPLEIQSALRQRMPPGPDEAGRYSRLGISLNLAGYIPETIWALAQAAKHSEDPQTLNNLAHALNLDADFTSARKILAAARSQAPKNAIILNNLAYASYHLNLLDEAEMAERQAVKLNPQPQYLWSLCKILREKKRPAEAEEFCSEARRRGIADILYPRDPRRRGSTQLPPPPPPDKPPVPEEEKRPDIKPPEGNEDEGMENVPDADDDASIIGQIGKRDRARDQKPPKPF